MTKQDAIKTLKKWLEFVERVPTNIKGKTDLDTGKKLTPVQVAKYYSAAQCLTREDVTEILENGFAGEQPAKTEAKPAKKTSKPAKKASKPANKMIKVIELLASATKQTSNLDDIYDYVSGAFLLHEAQQLTDENRIVAALRHYESL